MIKFVNDLRQVGGFLWVLRFPPPIKFTAKILTEIMLKVALNAITLTLIIYITSSRKQSGLDYCMKQVPGCGKFLEHFENRLSAISPPHLTISALSCYV